MGLSCHLCPGKTHNVRVSDFTFRIKLDFGFIFAWIEKERKWFWAFGVGSRFNFALPFTLSFICDWNYPAIFSAFCRISEVIYPSSNLYPDAKPVAYLAGKFLRRYNVAHFVLCLVEIRFFRIVHAPLFFNHFASDRRHMKEPDGSWTAQPPPYEPIVAQGKM